MTALDNREIAQKNVVAVFEREGLVADTSLLGDEAGTGATRRELLELSLARVRTAGETSTVDEARAKDGEVVDVLAVEERVAPVVVAVVLVALPGRVGFGCVVRATVIAGSLTGPGGVGGEDGAAAREIEIDVAAQMDCEAYIGPCRENQRASASGCDGPNGLIDRGCVYCLAVSRRAIGADVEERLRGSRRGGFG